MEIIDRLQRNRLATILIAIVSFVCAAAVYQYLRTSPQIGPNEEVFKTVDALFTALTTKDLQRLSDCESRLQADLESGALPSAAAKNLDGIIQRARAGKWDASADTLYQFILDQRRMR